MSTELGYDTDPEGWKKFMRRHRYVFILFVVGAVLVAVGVILVFLWFVGQAQMTGLVPTTLGLWSMDDLVDFLLNLLFWEVLLVGVPALVAAIAGWLWWRRLPYDERKEYRFFGPRSRSTDGGNAFSLLVFVAFAIKIYLDGNWSLPFGDWTFDYLVYSMLTALVWILIIFGIPVALGLIWWISRRMKRP
mgnify:CR=1 FL=1